MSVLSAILIGLASGIVFGFALEKSRVFEPGIIVGQLQLRNFVMLKIFLTAVITGLVVLAVLNGVFGVKLHLKPLVWQADIIGGLLLGAVVFIFFYLLTLQEEQVLEKLHGDVYRAYCAKVPRMIPNPALWHDAEHIEISPRIVRRTFFDALIFLVAVPAFEMLEKLQVAGHVPTLFHIY